MSKYNSMLSKPQEEFSEIKQEFDEKVKKIQKSLDETKKEFLEVASKYRYFDNDILLASPPVNRAYYSDRTAFVMASMAKLAYEPYEKGDVELELFISKLASGGFELVEIFSVVETQAFLAHNGKYAVLAFRGTEGKWQDIQSDIRTKRKRTEQGKIHSGFYDAYSLVSNQVKARLEDVKHLPLYITGHSLGGALATVATQDFEKSGYKDRIAACYTFGSPRVGNADFDKNIRSPIYRVLHFIDIVTFVPLFSMGFVPVGDVRYLTHGQPDDILRRVPLWHPLFIVALLATVLIPLVNVIFLAPAVGAHGSKKYVEKLERIALSKNQDIAMDIALDVNDKYDSEKEE